MKQRIAQLTGGALVTAMLLAGASSAFAQTYSTGTTGLTSNGTTYSAPASTNTTGVGRGASSSATGVTNSAASGSTSTTNSSGSTTPGIPNTGAGGDAAANIGIMTVAAVVVLGGAAYLWRRKTVLE